MVAAFNGKVDADYVENVKEDASSIPILKDLAQQGHEGSRPPTATWTSASKSPNSCPKVMFEHCTGYKHADNLGTYNSRFHQGRAVEGTIAGHDVEVGRDRLSRVLPGAGSGDGRERLHPRRAGAGTPRSRPSWS